MYNYRQHSLYWAIGLRIFEELGATMGQIAHALIEHHLTSEQIIKLPERLQFSTINVIAGQWTWTNPNLDEKLLFEIWNRKPEFFLRNSWSVKDLALLEKDNMTITSVSPTILTFDSLLRWYTYQDNELLRRQFNVLTKEITRLLNAIDIIMVPDLGSIDIVAEDENLTVSHYRQKANGNKMYAIEID